MLKYLLNHNVMKIVNFLINSSTLLSSLYPCSSTLSIHPSPITKIISKPNKYSPKVYAKNMLKAAKAQNQLGIGVVPSKPVLE